MSETESKELITEPLPDLVQCARPGGIKDTVKTPPSRATAKKVTKRTASKTLKEFARCNLSQFDEESRYECIMLSLG